MSRSFSTDFLLEVAMGNIAGHEIISVSSRNPSVGTGITDIWTIGGNRVWLEADTAMEMLSSDANDTIAGTGARTIIVQGIQLDGTVVNQVVDMDGVTPVALITDIARINNMLVTSTGTYASTTAGGNIGTITLRTVAGPVSQAEILVEDTVPDSQAQTSHFSVKAGVTAYILGFRIGVDGNKDATLLLNIRQNYDNVSAPFDAPITVARFDGLTGLNAIKPFAPIGGVVLLPEKTDIWFSALTSAGTSSVTVQYQLLLVDN